HWAEAECLWDRLSGKLPPGQQITVRFESLIQEPVRELTRACEFCGVPYHEALLDYPRRSTYALPDARMIASWKRKMSPRDVQLPEARSGWRRRAGGYALGGCPPPRGTCRLERRLRRGDRWGRFAFRIRRYGFSLVLQDFLTRRLRLSGPQRKVRAR